MSLLMLKVKQGSCEYQFLLFFGLTRPGINFGLSDGCSHLASISQREEWLASIKHIGRVVSSGQTIHIDE